MKLLKKIKTKKAIIGVVGLGYVGLPLCIRFLEKGFKVKGPIYSWSELKFKYVSDKSIIMDSSKITY